MPRVFISHTSDGRDYARALSEALKSFGDITFFDEAEMASGESISSLIRRKLQAADVIAVLLTAGAVESPWVMFEIGAAEGFGKRVVPILIADVDPDRLDYLRRDRSFLDARNMTAAQAAERLKLLAIKD